MKYSNPDNRLVSLDQLADIRKNLPHGTMRALATKNNCSYQHITNVIKGRTYDENIIEQALNIALVEKEKREKKRAELQGKLKKLTA